MQQRRERRMAQDQCGLRDQEGHRADQGRDRAPDGLPAGQVRHRQLRGHRGHRRRDRRRRLRGAVPHGISRPLAAPRHRPSAGHAASDRQADRRVPALAPQQRLLPAVCQRRRGPRGKSAEIPQGAGATGPSGQKRAQDREDRRGGIQERKDRFHDRRAALDG